MDHVHRAHSPLVLRGGNAPPPILFDELVFEILSWLPVKSLVRFKCVCKYWKSIISNPWFIKEHLQKSQKSTDLTLTLGSMRNNTVTFANICSVRSSLKQINITKYLSYPLDCRCVGTCNGLVCLVQAYRCKDIRVHFWNPATRQIYEISTCLLERDPIISPLFGFGYDNLNDTYKLVSVVPLAKEENAAVKVYSLDDKCWRNIQNFPDVVVRDNGVYLTGTLNWLELVDFNFNESHNWLACVIVSLDLGKETYTQLTSPRLRRVSRFYPTLGVLMDYLSLFHDYERTHFVVWQMKGFGLENPWTQLLKVSYQDIPIYAPGDSLSSMRIMRNYDNGDILITVEDDHHLQVVLYNQRVQPVKTFCDIYILSMARIMDYVESLVSPK